VPSGKWVAKARLVRTVDVLRATGILYVWSGSRSVRRIGTVARASLNVWVIGNEIRFRGMARVLVLPRYGLLIVGSVEWIDTHGSPPIEP
jgi:hypothetical protein